MHITTNDGADWSDITPPGAGEALINSIDISPHDPAKAFVAVTKYKFNDMRPMIYKTNNYGKSWQKIISGIAPNSYVRVVREDPKVPGILYAGTENGLYVSFDEGRKWEAMQLNF